MPVKRQVSCKQYLEIVRHYESCLEEHGDCHLGVDWPKREDVDTRYKVMLDITKDHVSDKISLLDFGCGASHLFEYILRHQLNNIVYSGLDISDKFISLSRHKFPYINYYCVDVLDDATILPEFDFIIMNGVFTVKRSLPFDNMFSYFQDVILSVFPKSRVGIAFNVMSKHVDWERDDLFHLPFDLLAAFLTKKVCRNFVFRNDYGLHEYTTYVFRALTSPKAEVPDEGESPRKSLISERRLLRGISFIVGVYTSFISNLAGAASQCYLEA